jgi:hypothetical protein
MNTVADKAYILGVAIISTAIIYISWGHDAPLANFALVVGGLFLGHVLTIVLDDTGTEKEEG